MMAGISSTGGVLAGLFMLWSFHVSSATYDGIIETGLVRWRGNSQKDSYSLNTRLVVRFDAHWEGNGVTVDITSIAPVAVEGEMRKDDETLVEQIAVFSELLADHGTVRFSARDGGIHAEGLGGRLPPLVEADWERLETKLDAVEDHQVRELTKTLMAILAKLPIARLEATAKLEIGAEASMPFRTLREGSSEARTNRLFCNRLDETKAGFFYGDMRQIGKRCLIVAKGQCLFELNGSKMISASEEVVRKIAVNVGGVPQGGETVHERASVRRAE